MKKIKQFVKDHPDESLLIGLATLAASVIGVAIYADVKEMKRQGSWIDEQEAAGNTILMDELGRLVAVPTVASIYR